MEAHGADREPGSIYWREASKDELEPAGRPRSVDPEAVLALLPPEGLSAAEWKNRAEEEEGIPKTTFHRIRRDLLGAGRCIKTKATNRWQPVTK